MTRVTRAVLASSILLALADLAHAAPRAFVSSGGNDLNACTFAAPCRSFQVAHNNVDPNGEIVALDAAGYGGVTITKSVTITANPGFYAGSAAGSGAAVTIATPGVNVVLRGLNFNGIGGNNAVMMTAGDSLTIENCVISNFLGPGVDISSGMLRVVGTVFRGNAVGIAVTNGAQVNVAGSTFIGNLGFGGIYSVNSTASTTQRVNVVDTTFTGNYLATYTRANDAAANSITTISRSSAIGNQFGFTGEGSAGGTVITSMSYSNATGNSSSGVYQAGTTVFQTLGNNHIRQNGVDVTGTLTPAVLQ